MKIKRGMAAISIAATAALGLTACTTDADKASENISTAAEAFEVQRTIVGINGISGATIFYAEGRCSFEYPSESRVDVTCKYGPDEYRRHTFILGDQDSVVVSQEVPIDVSEYHTRIVLKPQKVATRPYESAYDAKRRRAADRKLADSSRSIAGGILASMNTALSRFRRGVR